VDRWFRRLQLVYAGAYSLGHGINDAQKGMGIITAARWLPAECCSRFASRLPWFRQPLRDSSR
jgi:phosphate/sulfate permease